VVDDAGEKLEDIPAGVTAVGATTPSVPIEPSSVRAFNLHLSAPHPTLEATFASPVPPTPCRAPASISICHGLCATALLGERQLHLTHLPPSIALVLLISG